MPHSHKYISIIVFCLCWLSSCKQDQNLSYYELSIIEDRKLKDEDFKLNPDSPLPPSVKKNFDGLFYFEPDSSWIVKAKLEVITSNEFMRRNALDSTRLYKAFNLRFTRDNQPVNLTAFWNDSTHKSLFIPFRDSTSGNLSYGGGRFLEVAFSYMTKDSFIVIDFNRCYNPYCAYNPEYSCPIPPQENTLPFAVKAGERLFEERP